MNFPNFPRPFGSSQTRPVNDNDDTSHTGVAGNSIQARDTSHNDHAEQNGIRHSSSRRRVIEGPLQHYAHQPSATPVPVRLYQPDVNANLDGYSRSRVNSGSRTRHGHHSNQSHHQRTTGNSSNNNPPKQVSENAWTHEFIRPVEGSRTEVQCAICLDPEVQLLRNCVRHVKNVHFKDFPEACVFCCKPDRPSNLDRHTRSSHPGLSCFCIHPGCERVFCWRRGYDVPMCMGDHPIYPCLSCGRVFPTFDEFNAHGHDYVCQQCGMTFQTMDALRSHQQTSGH